MPKHRRPSAVSRLAASAKRPLNAGIAAGVASTVAVTGTVVAVAADEGATPRARSATGPAARSAPDHTRPGLRVTAPAERTSGSDPDRQLDQHRAQAMARKRIGDAERRAAARRERAHRLAVERAKARKAAKAERAARQEADRAASRAADSRAHRSASRSSSRTSASSSASASATRVLQVAAAQSGDRYSYGAAGPDVFDCSGFTQYVFGQVGISLPHSSSAQAGVVSRISSPRPGDLVFVYNGGGGSIGHVAIYAGGGYWYEASNPSQPVGKHRAWSTNVSYGRLL